MPALITLTILGNATEINMILFYYILELARLNWVDQGLFISGLTAVLPVWEVSNHAYQWLCYNTTIGI
jgi:hypothetical protein